MCVVSMVVDSVTKQWPAPQYWPAPVPQDMTEIIGRLAQIDSKLGAKDCYDPKKEAFLQQLADRVAAIEKAQQENK